MTPGPRFLPTGIGHLHMQAGDPAPSLLPVPRSLLFPAHIPLRASQRLLPLPKPFDMQAAMGAFQALGTRAGVFRLAMRAGLATGPMFGTIVGDLVLRKQLRRRQMLRARRRTVGVR